MTKSKFVTYVETSALLRWLFSETGAAKVQQQLERSEVVCSSIITLVEVYRAIRRAYSLGAISSETYTELLEIVPRLKSAWMIMQITQEVELGASRSFSHEPVRSIDALHILTALEFKKAFPHLSVLTFDSRIEKNLPELGLRLALV